MRGMVMDAMVVHVSLVGDHSSAASAALGSSLVSVVWPPPVTSTVPSGHSVRMCYARSKGMGGVSRQRAGFCVRSSTYVVPCEDVYGGSVSPFEVPDLRIFQGWYIAELPPSSTAGSIVVQGPVAGS